MNGRQKTFTLVELLVVIAILGILLSLLLPALSKSRDIAKFAVCKSNLKQIYIAFTSYSTKNNQAYPLTTTQDWAGFKAVSWDDRISGYDGREALSTAQQNLGKLDKSSFSSGYGSVYKCPADDAQRSFGGNLDCLPLSYAVNYYHNGLNRYKGIIGKNGGTAYSLKLSQVNEASETIILSESMPSGRMLGRFWRSFTAPKYISDSLLDKFPHNGIKPSSNYAFADGSVKAMNFYSTIESGSVTNVTNTLWDAQK